MRAAHHAVVVTGDIDEKLVELNVLLLECAGYVIELHAGNGKNGLLIHLGVIKAVEQMNAAGTRGGETNTEPAGELRVRAGHECRRFLVPDVDKADLVLRPCGELP